MRSSVRFENVSKQFRLGQTRTSLGHMLRNALLPDSRTVKEDQVLWALKNVSFELFQGQTLGLIGSNGAGKTTMLKILANITQPTSGKVDIQGRISALIELGAGFHADLTGRENIFLNGTILGLKRKEIKSRFDEIVDFSEIERFIDTPVKRYSSGMRVRLGFAVAACISPDVLLVDEVLAVGDATFRQKCMKRIQTLRQNGTAIIFVSHNLYMVQAVCTSALYLEHGQVKYLGATSEAIDLYERDVHEQRARQFEDTFSQQTTPAAGVEITQVQVLDDTGSLPQQFQSDQQAEVRIEYLAHKEIDKANVVVRIIRSDGLTCCMMRTSLDDVHMSLQPGPGVLSVNLESLQLVGSTYFIDARVTDAADVLVLATGRSKWFYVEGVALSHEEQSGVFEPKRKWDQSADSSTFAAGVGNQRAIESP